MSGTITLPCGHIMVEKTYKGGSCWVCEKGSSRSPKLKFRVVDEVLKIRSPPRPSQREGKRQRERRLAAETEEKEVTINFE